MRAADRVVRSYWGHGDDPAHPGARSNAVRVARGDLRDHACDRIGGPLPGASRATRLDQPYTEPAGIDPDGSAAGADADLDADRGVARQHPGVRLAAAVHVVSDEDLAGALDRVADHDGGAADRQYGAPLR